MQVYYHMTRCWDTPGSHDWICPSMGTHTCSSTATHTNECNYAYSGTSHVRESESNESLTPWDGCSAMLTWRCESRRCSRDRQTTLITLYSWTTTRQPTPLTFAHMAAEPSHFTPWADKQKNNRDKSFPIWPMTHTCAFKTYAHEIRTKPSPQASMYAVHYMCLWSLLMILPSFRNNSDAFFILTNIWRSYWVWCHENSTWVIKCGTKYLAPARKLWNDITWLGRKIASE